MVTTGHATENFNIEQVELKGFSRSIAEIEWLLLILVLLYFVTNDIPADYQLSLVVVMVVFACFVLAFHYLNFYESESRWKLATETWVMIVFISLVLWFTGKIDSPLLNLYLIVIIASALTLGKTITLLEFALITCVYLQLALSHYGTDIYTFETFSVLMSQFTPFLMIAYLTTMLSADLQYARKMFKLLSETDDLTGLQNTRSFKTNLLKEVKKAIRYNRPFSLMMIDADNLKDVNDQHGHETGNQLIKNLADTIQDCLRESDILARYGGDEFICLLPETGAENAKEAAERIRSAVENTSFDSHGNRVSATVSIGVACYPDVADNIEEIIHKADKALYESKSRGKNTVVIFSDK